MTLTHKGAAEMLNAIMDNQAKSFTYGLELGLFTQAASGAGTAPSQDNTNIDGAAGTPATEIDTGGGYGRQSITFGGGTPGASEADTSVLAESGGLTWTTASADWGSTTHSAPAWIGGWCIYSTDVTPIGVWVGAFTTAKQVLNGDTASITSGDLTLQLA